MRQIFSVVLNAESDVLRGKLHIAAYSDSPDGGHLSIEQNFASMRVIARPAFFPKIFP